MRTKLISIIVILLTLGTFTNALSAEYILKLAADSTPKLACIYTGVLFEQEVEKKSKGRIDVQFFHSKQLGGEVEYLDKLLSGVIQGSLNSCCILARVQPFANVMQLPYLFPTWEKADVFLKSDLASQVLESLAKVDLKGLGFTSYGISRLAANKPFKTLEDLSTFKFRSAETPLYIEILRTLGVHPTPLPFPEVYEALKTGVYDGVDMSPECIHLVKWDEVIKYVSDTNHMVGWYILSVKKSWLEKLPLDLQKTIIEVGKEVTDKTMRMADEREKEALAAFDKEGIKIIKLSHEERMKFIRRLQPIHQKFEKDIGKDFLQKMYKLLNYKH
jgi:TRAP-type C4-dicarboxylate transport system substrate-binding protein